MGRTAKKLKVNLFMIDHETGLTHKWDELTEKQKEKYREQMAINSGKMLGYYFADHPEEYDKLPSKGGKAYAG